MPALRLTHRLPRRAAVALPLMFVLVASALVGRAAPALASSTTYTWQGGNGYGWGTENNWSPPGKPRDGDSVIIKANTGECANAHVEDVPTVTLADLTVVDDGDNGGTCYASLTGGQITVTRHALFDGGLYRTSLVIAAGAIAGVRPNHPRTPTFDAPVDVQGTLALQNATVDRALVITAGHTLHIAPGGTLVSVGDNDVRSTSCCATPAHVTNEGTLQESRGGTLSVDGVELDQLKNLDVDGTVVSRNAPVTTADGADYSGSGSWSLQQVVTGHFAGTQHLGKDFRLVLGGLASATSEAIGGTFALSGQGTFDWNGGTVEGDVTIGHGVNVALSGARNNNDRRFLWGQDTTVGKTPAPATRFTNHGTVTFSHKADLYTEYAARFVNAKDGTVQLGAGSRISSYTCCVNPDRLTNAGRVSVQGPVIGTAPTTLHDVDLVQTGGTTDLGPRSILAPDRGLAISGGALVGTGTVKGNVHQTGGQLSPGRNGPGTLHITGSYTAGKRVRLLVDIAKKAMDHVVIAATAALGGSIAVHDFLYTPHLGELRTALSAAHGTHGSYGCVTTSGPGSTGKHALHWNAKVQAVALTLRSAAGGRTRC